MTAISNNQNESGQVNTAARQRSSAERQKLQPSKEALFDQFSTMLDEITQSLIASEDYRDFQASLARSSEQTATAKAASERDAATRQKAENAVDVRTSDTNPQSNPEETPDTSSENLEPEAQEATEVEAVESAPKLPEAAQAQPVSAEVVSQTAATVLVDTEKPVQTEELVVTGQVNELPVEEQLPQQAEKAAVQAVENAVVEAPVEAAATTVKAEAEVQTVAEATLQDPNPAVQSDSSMQPAAELSLPVSEKPELIPAAPEQNPAPVKAPAAAPAAAPVTPMLQESADITARLAENIRERLNNQADSALQAQQREVVRAQAAAVVSRVEIAPVVANLSSVMRDTLTTGSQLQQSALRLIQESGSLRSSEASAQARAQQAVQAMGAPVNTQNNDNGTGFENLGKALKTLTRGDAQRTLEKVQNALKEVSRSHDGKSISLRLDPPSLGNVKIDITYREGVLHARVVAESPAVNSMLREKSAELQSLLRKVGIDADRVSVSVGSDSGAANSFGESYFEARERQAATGSQRTGSGLSRGLQQSRQTASQDDHWVA